MGHPSKPQDLSLTASLPPPWGSWRDCLFLLFLHQSVINPTFLFSLYFIRGKLFVTGTFLYIYTIHKGRKNENGKYVCTSVASRVHTVG